MKFRNEGEYEPYCGNQYTSISFIAIICILAFGVVFATSGLAVQFHYNEIMCITSLMIFVLLPYKRPLLRGVFFKVLFNISIVLIAILTAINYYPKAYQFINIVSCFGIICFSQLFARIKWEQKNLFKLGVILSIFELILIYMFLPGQLLSGWNSNSISGSIPILFMGLSCMWCSRHKRLWWAIILVLLGAFFVTSTLENRSTLLTILLFTVLMGSGFFTFSRKRFRFLYISIILINILIPFLNSVVANLDIFNDLLGATSAMTVSGKIGEGGFNGREELWSRSIALIMENPLFGIYGVRPLYPHNFSMDLLIQFGWVGWLTFMGMLVSLLETAFRKGSKYNLFLIAFMSVLFLNTFENNLSCCNTMGVFLYILLGVALRINRDVNFV